MPRCVVVDGRDGKGVVTERARKLDLEISYAAYAG